MGSFSLFCIFFLIAYRVVALGTFSFRCDISETVLFAHIHLSSKYLGNLYVDDTY